METEYVFKAASMLATLQWLLLIILPNSKLNRWLMAYAVVPLLLSVIYCIYIIGFFNIQGGGFGSIQQVRTLFNNDNLLLAGWVHYLAFDLLAGFAIVKSAQEHKLSHFIIIPCLILTFMFGPVGFLLYQIIKYIKITNEKAV
jgi:hypothetical protein